jgi:hypothetical protein
MNVKAILNVLAKCGDFTKLSVSKLQKVVTTIEYIIGQPIIKPDIMELNSRPTKELWRHFFNQSQSLINEVDHTSLELELGVEPDEHVVMDMCIRLVNIIYHKRVASLKRSREELVMAK